MTGTSTGCGTTACTSTSLGVMTIRNALVSYALFQDWGNDPLKYESVGAHRQLLDTIEGLFPAGKPEGRTPRPATTSTCCSG